MRLTARRRARLTVEEGKLHVDARPMRPEYVADAGKETDEVKRAELLSEVAPRTRVAFIAEHYIQQYEQAREHATRLGQTNATLLGQVMHLREKCRELQDRIYELEYQLRNASHG